MLLIFSNNPSLPPRLVCDCYSYWHLNTTLAASVGVPSVNTRYCKACLVLELSCFCLIQTVFPYLIEAYFVLGLKKYMQKTKERKELKQGMKEKDKDCNEKR